MQQTRGVRWGFMGCGRIANDFANALKGADGAVLQCCAARSESSSSRFASTHGFAKHGTYEDLLKDKDVEVVYVNTLHHMHKEHALMCLQAGKHVLVEKPIAITYADALELVEEARRRKLFLMEGMWTRFFPAVRKARELLHKIGTVKAVYSDFGFVLDAESRPHMVDPAQGGGGLMEIGVYPIAAAIMCLQSAEEVKALGQVEKQVDMAASISLRGKSGGLGVLSYTLYAQTPEETLIVGPEGRIRIHAPAHCPTKITFTRVISREQSLDDEFEFPLPLPHASARLADGDTSTCGCKAPYQMFHYPNSIGFQYQADAVMECIRKGQLESSEYTLDESLQVMSICDQVRRDLGVQWPSEASTSAGEKRLRER